MNTGSEAGVVNAGLASNSKMVTMDPKTGEIVGGLRGLHDLIRMKQEKSVLKKQTNDETSERLTTKQNNKSEAFGIKANQVVYAETKRVGGQIVDILLYAMRDDGVIYTFTPQLFGDKQSEFCRDVNRMLRANDKMFMTTRHDELKIYIHKDMPITAGASALVYNNKYELMSSSGSVYQKVKECLSQSESTVSTKNTETAPKNVRNEDSAKSNQSSDSGTNGGSKKGESTKAVKAVVKDKNGSAEAKAKKVNDKAKPGKVANSKEEDKKPDKKADYDNMAKKDENTTSGRAESAGKTPEIIINLDKLREVNESLRSSDNDKKEADKIDVNVVKTVLDVHKIVKAAGDNPTLSDVVKTVLLLHQADGTVIKTLFGLDDARTAEIIDELRRMRALGGVQDDGSYRILIDSVKQLGKDAEYTLMSSADNYRAVVQKVPVRGRYLVYDLDELRTVQVAEEFTNAVANFCAASNSHLINHLFDNSVELDIPVSQVLQTISADEAAGGYNTGDYELFNAYVTRYMLAAGWMADDNGYPWFMFDVDKTNGLVNDILKYLMVNLPWIKAIYSPEVIEIMLVNLTKLDVENSINPEVEPLRDALCQMIADTMSDDGADDAISDDQLELPNKLVAGGDNDGVAPEPLSTSPVTENLTK